MNVRVENGEGCLRSVKFELPAEELEKVRETVVNAFRREAKIKGFRPGRAPREMVEKRFEREIDEETQERAANRAFLEWLKESNTALVSLIGFEDMQWRRGEPLSFTAEVEVEPEVPLPSYRGIEVRRPSDRVSDEEVEATIEDYRSRQADFRTVEDRPLGHGDFASISYTGVVDGKPIAEIDPEAGVLSEGERQWIEISDDSFLPGFAEALVGMSPGDRRQIHLDIPAEFGRPLLAGKKASFFVELVEIRERVLPAVDDELARRAGAENLEDWKEKIRELIGRLKEAEARQAVRGEVIERLLAGAEFPLPESERSRETQRRIYDMVRESQQRGISRDTLEEHKEELFGHAVRSAEQRLRLRYILRGIAREEKIEVEDAEVDEEIRKMAEAEGTDPAALRADLEKRELMDVLRLDLLEAKALDFVIANASVTAE